MDSKRWTQDLPAEVRDVLQAGLAHSAPRGTKQAVWTALATKLPAATAGAAAGSMSMLSILKPLAMGLALGTVTAAGVMEIRSKTAPPPRPSGNGSAMRVSAAPPGASPGELSPPSLKASATVDPIAPSQPSKSAPRSEVAEPSAPSPAGQPPIAQTAPGSGGSSIAAFPDEAIAAPREDVTVLESRRLNQARAALRVGAAQRALAQLDAMSLDFPSGVLVQERDALRIEALLGLGQRQRASELARAFLEQYPQSPHAAAVQRALH
jgi:hypothetical protein